MAHLASSAKVNLTKATEAVKVAVVSRHTEAQKKIAMASTSIAAMAMSSPAFALVEEQLPTEGLGLPFGIDDPLQFWLGIGTFGVVWGVWLQSVKEFGNQDGEESSL